MLAWMTLADKIVVWSVVVAVAFLVGVIAQTIWEKRASIDGGEPSRLSEAVEQANSGRVQPRPERSRQREQPKKCPCKTPNHELPWCDRNPEFLQRDVDDANRGLTARIDGGEQPNE